MFVSEQHQQQKSESTEEEAEATSSSLGLCVTDWWIQRSIIASRSSLLHTQCHGQSQHWLHADGLNVMRSTTDKACVAPQIFAAECSYLYPNGSLPMIRHMQLSVWPQTSARASSSAISTVCVLPLITSAVRNESNLTRGTSASLSKAQQLITFSPWIHFALLLTHPLRLLRRMDAGVFSLLFCSSTSVQIYLNANGPPVYSSGGQSGPRGWLIQARPPGAAFISHSNASKHL